MKKLQIEQEIKTSKTWRFDEAKPGDLVTADVVMDFMNAMPPATMARYCAQLGEPYSHEKDAHNGSWRPTYATWKCVEGDFNFGVWQFCGYCFKGETIERWRTKK